MEYYVDHGVVDMLALYDECACELSEIKYVEPLLQKAYQSLNDITTQIGELRNERTVDNSSFPSFHSKNNSEY